MLVWRAGACLHAGCGAVYAARELCRTDGFACPSQVLSKGSLHCLPSGTPSQDGARAQLACWRPVWNYCSDTASWTSLLWHAFLRGDMHASLMDSLCEMTCSPGGSPAVDGLALLPLHILLATWCLTLAPHVPAGPLVPGLGALQCAAGLLSWLQALSDAVSPLLYS